MSETIRVLVVDDDAGARSLHCRFIAEIPGFTVVGAAGTGEAALQQSRANVDLVLLDMRLPDISGVEVLHRLRTLAVGGPDVLVISSSRDQVTVRQALAAHVVGYLIKPFTQDVLRERLDAYAAERRDRSDDGHDLPMAQGQIDRLLSTATIRVSGRDPMVEGDVAGSVRRIGGASTDRQTLPKGLAQVTLDRVREALSPVTPASAAEIAAACGISRATARRYLDHLLSTGAIDLAHRYGKRGRPNVLYRLAPTPDV